MSTNLRTAAQQALEALESLFTLQVDYARPKQCGDAITALRAALEQPERAQAMRDAGYTRRPTLREMADPEQPEQEDEMQKMLRSLGFDDQCPESIGITLRRWKDGYAAALKQPEQPEQDQFCDSHCTWLDHHPECVRAKQERNA